MHSGGRRMTTLPLSQDPPAAQAAAPRRGHPRRVPLSTLTETAVVGVVALATRLPGLAHEPWGDELYHILSARDYLETGVFGINGGSYPRSIAYSEMVAGLYQLFGVSPVVARLPALMAAVLTIVVLFAWLRRSGERLAAWVAAAVLIFTPDLVEQAQYARFYPLQHLFLLLAAVALAALLARPYGSWRRMAVLGAASAISIAVALYFQTLTVIGAAGLIAGAVLVAGPGMLAALPMRQRLGLAAGAAVALAAGAALMLQLDFGQKLLALATYTDLWAEGTRNEIRYYHWMLLDDYPAAWTLFPVLAVFALVRERRIATLALSVFVVGFVAHTLLAWKSARYISYALPFFAAVVGLGVAHAAPAVRAAIERLLPGGTRGRRVLHGLTFAGMVGFILLANSGFTQTLRLLARDQAYLYPGGPTPTLSWAHAAPTLAPIAAEVDAVVSTEDLEAIWFLDRLDFVLDRDHLLQGRPKPEFSVDGKIMAQMIGSTESLRRVVACNETGLLVAMRWALTSYKMAPETAEFIRHSLEPVPLPDRTGLVAYRWSNASGVRLSGCPGLPVQGEPLP